MPGQPSQIRSLPLRGIRGPRVVDPLLQRGLRNVHISPVCSSPSMCSLNASFKGPWWGFQGTWTVCVGCQGLEQHIIFPLPTSRVDNGGMYSQSICKMTCQSPLPTVNPLPTPNNTTTITTAATTAAASGYYYYWPPPLISANLQPRAPGLLQQSSWQ